jgi:SIR2-like domain
MEDKNGMALKLAKLANQGKLIVVVGAGVSVGLSKGRIPGWLGLIKNGLLYAKDKGCISPKQFEGWDNILNSDDTDELLSAAEFFSKKIGAPNGALYASWMRDVFQDVSPVDEDLSDSIRLLSRNSVPICTLNYDSLLSKVTGLPPITLNDSAKTHSWVRRELSSILHLHGAWDEPASCILGVRDYSLAGLDPVRQLMQKAISLYSNLLFIGCGDTFSDPNFSALISWLKSHAGSALPNHYALVLDSDVASRNMDQAWSGFVDPIGYGQSHSDLPKFIQSIFSGLKQPVVRKKRIDSEANSRVIDSYKAFLIRDCGQMTIEGVSADMETGQRKFDLERLFVPLKVTLCPPNISASDPERGRKLAEWNFDKKPREFGALLAKEKRIALLALPGGGKSLLLKRLAVAYSSTARRIASEDELPSLELLPILIRCREWREHIQLPISGLLKKMPDLTGQDDLRDLYPSLAPLLKKGKVLLMIDGLDEIHKDSDREIFVENVEKFIEEYPLIRLVVTSREAGFDLVAPKIARFCSRWRIDPLEPEAIESLCSHWHKLMSGDTPSASVESASVAKALVESDSLRRLAENPLLLTMLLVVKHGAGGLPPDRVGLYERAVDVLLDTWNIKGHDPLNSKEAVPQLSYIAYELMCQGKQTATENELLALLSSARETHKNIQRYAKDSPHEFLKRVELRSSLLMEAGFQLESSKTVPFYQFRHLTFQEYLTAVAIVEGHYGKYLQGNDIVAPLDGWLDLDEWKEVIPMVAVLAGKHAEPLIRKLVEMGEHDLKISSEERDLRGSTSDSINTSSAISRLFQCLVEEAEISPELLPRGLRLIFYYARRLHTNHEIGSSWEKLCKGPYGPDLAEEAISRINEQSADPLMWDVITCGSILCHRRGVEYLCSAEGVAEVGNLLNSPEQKSRQMGLLYVAGYFWNKKPGRGDAFLEGVDWDALSRLAVDEDVISWVIAGWVISFSTRINKPKLNNLTDQLDKHIERWLGTFSAEIANQAAYFFVSLAGLPREDWTPKLSVANFDKVKKILGSKNYLNDSDPLEPSYYFGSAILVAYYSKNIIEDRFIGKAISRLKRSQSRSISSTVLRKALDHVEEMVSVPEVRRKKKYVSKK